VARFDVAARAVVEHRIGLSAIDLGRDLEGPREGGGLPGAALEDHQVHVAGGELSAVVLLEQRQFPGADDVVGADEAEIAVVGLHAPDRGPDGFEHVGAAFAAVEVAMLGVDMHQCPARHVGQPRRRLPAAMAEQDDLPGIAVRDALNGLLLMIGISFSEAASATAQAAPMHAAVAKRAAVSSAGGLRTRSRIP
jgi:hypothetical protein